MWIIIQKDRDSMWKEKCLEFLTVAKTVLVSLSVISSCNFIFHKLTSDWGKWKRLKCGNQSTEMEVQKLKYGSEKKSCLFMFSASLTYDRVC